jgi:hypothetical protein
MADTACQPGRGSGGDLLLKRDPSSLTAHNFNPVIAMAAETVIASADNIVPIGVIAPDHVVTPAPVVDYLVANA